jgi:hypothetical protein
VGIRNIPPTPHHAASEASLSQIATSIKQAAEDRNWKVTSEAPGLLTVRLWVRNRHLAIVQIGFDNENYWIDYLDSENLEYVKEVWKAGLIQGSDWWLDAEPKIHRNYNRWVESLAKSIEYHIANPIPAAETQPVSSDSLHLIADELEKLDALRVRGILTQQEFEQQKEKLLAR